MSPENTQSNGRILTNSCLRGEKQLCQCIRGILADRNKGLNQKRIIVVAERIDDIRNFLDSTDETTLFVSNVDLDDSLNGLLLDVFFWDPGST